MSASIEQRLLQYRTAIDEAAARLTSGAATDATATDSVVRLVPTPPRKRTWSVAFAAAVLIVGAVGVVAWRISNDESKPPTTEPNVTRPTTTREVTEPPARRVTPYLLIDGWTAPMLDTFDRWDGVEREHVRTATFERGDRTLRMYWTAGSHDRLTPADPPDAGRVGRHSVLGRPVEIIRSIDNHGAIFTARWADGDVDIEVTTQGGPIGTLGELEQALDDVRSVSLEEFEAAFPASDRSPGDEESAAARVSPTRTRGLPPFLLFDGWTLVELFEDDEWNGTTPSTPRSAVYELGDRQIEVYWYAFDNHVDKLRERVASAYRVTLHVVLGHRAQVGYSSSDGGQASAVWTEGITTVEVRSDDFGGASEFLQALDSIRSVERAEFEAALI